MTPQSFDLRKPCSYPTAPGSTSQTSHASLDTSVRLESSGAPRLAHRKNPGYVRLRPHIRPILIVLRSSGCRPFFFYLLFLSNVSSAEIASTSREPTESIRHNISQPPAFNR